MATSENEDDKPIFEQVTVFGDEIDDKIEKQIRNINGRRKWEILKTKLPNDAGFKVTVYFTDEKHTNASFLWGNLSKCSEKYTYTRVVVKGMTNKDSVADSKTKSRIEFYYGGVAPVRKPIDVSRSDNIVLEYHESFPSGIATSPEAGGFELLASLMEKNLGTIPSTDDDGNYCKRKYKILPPETLTSVTSGAYLIQVSNITNEFYYETAKDMFASTFGKLCKHKLAPDVLLFVHDSDLYMFVENLKTPAATTSRARGQGHGLRKPLPQIESPLN